jgi:hypothetical protein
MGGVTRRTFEVRIDVGFSRLEILQDLSGLMFRQALKHVD